MRIAVTGASGRLGRRVVEELTRRVDAASVVALSRDPARIADLGVRTARADMDDPEGLVAAFDGADRLLLVSTDQIGRRLAQHTNAVAAAVRAGVGHVFYTSAPRVGDTGNPAPVVPEHRGTEAALAASGLSWTALRNGTYAETLLLSVRPAVAAGVYASNSGDGGIAYIPRDELAAATAAILAAPADPGRVLELTGREAVTGADLAAILTGLSGRDVRFQPLTDEIIEAGMARGGLSPDAITMALGFGRAAREGYLGIVTDTVQTYLGRPPTSVAEYLARHREALTV